MLRWLFSLLGLTGEQPVAERAEAAPTSPGPSSLRSGQAKEARPALPAEALEFLSGVVSPCAALDLQSLPGDDRIFLSGILRKINDNKLEIPVLPRAALEISRLLANPDSNLTEFVRILNDDPALSVDVLRAANSAYYGFSSPARSIRDALARVGVAQIKALLVVSHLKGKVLKGGSFHREAGWLSELSSALAAAGKALARHLGLSGDEAFTKGLLFQVEHFVILGTASELSKEHQRHLHPSVSCLRDAFWRLGPKVRTLAVKAWELDELLARDLAEDPLARPYTLLRRALVASWSGQSVEPVDGVPMEDLERALAACARG